MSAALRARLARLFALRLRLVLALGCALAAYAALPAAEWRQEVRLLVAYDVGALLYLAFAGLLMSRSTHERIRSRARMQDEGRIAILAAVVLGSVATLVAIAALLSVAKGLHGAARTGHVLLAALTVVVSWAFTQVVFALHYAHAYYGGPGERGDGGLAFPGDQPPGYGDFLYLACVIGTSGQTADVAFTSGGMRLIGVVHCIQAFFFNATLLALSVNIAAGLL